MLLLSQLFQNPGSSILPIFSTHSYFNNIAKNISCFIKILHTCLDVFIVLFPNSKLFFQHTVCKYCCSEKIMESFSKGPLLLVRVQFSAYIMIAFKYSHWEKTFINILLLYIVVLQTKNGPYVSRFQQKNACQQDKERGRSHIKPLIFLTF